MSRLLGRLLDASNSPQTDPRRNTRTDRLFPRDHRGIGQRDLPNQQYYDDDDYYTTQAQPYHQSRRSVRRANRGRKPGLISTLINAGTEVYMSKKSSDSAAGSSSDRPSSLSAKERARHIDHVTDVSDDDFSDDDDDYTQTSSQSRPQLQWSRPDIFGQQYPVPAPQPPMNRRRPDAYERRSRSEGQQRQWVESEHQSRFESEEIEPMPPTYEQIPPTYHEAMRQMSGGVEIEPAVPARSPFREQFPLVETYEKGRPVGR